jgi:hypothetical protein
MQHYLTIYALAIVLAFPLDDAVVVPFALACLLEHSLWLVAR